MKARAGQIRMAGMNQESVDDSRANVEAASRVGLHTLQYVDESTIAMAAQLLGLP
jgi:hypothetical protein